MKFFYIYIYGEIITLDQYFIIMKIKELNKLSDQLVKIWQELESAKKRISNIHAEIEMEKRLVKQNKGKED